MKTLSIKQPWAYAITHLGKRIENRSWSTKYRGPVLLHASKGMSTKEYSWAMRWMQQRGFVPRLPDIPYEKLLRGGIVGRANLVDVISPAYREAWGDERRRVNRPTGLSDDDMLWHMDECYGFVLADVEVLPFVPLKGKLGLFQAEYPVTPRAPQKTAFDHLLEND